MYKTGCSVIYINPHV